MTPGRRTATRDHDLRMHLGVVLMAAQMISRPSFGPLTGEQRELIDIIKRAAKAMETVLDESSGTRKKT